MPGRTTRAGTRASRAVGAVRPGRRLAAERRRGSPRAAPRAPRRGRGRSARGSRPPGISPSLGWRPGRARSSSVSEPSRSVHVCRPASMRSNRTRSGSVRSRSSEPIRIGSSARRPNVIGPPPGIPSTTRSSSPSQKGSISATWASTSRGPHDASGSVPKVAGQRPRLAAGHSTPAARRRRRGRDPSRSSSFGIVASVARGA